jgi:hypothetical protein
MGRPIKKKFFGDLASGGIGGEGIATVSFANTGLHYSVGSTVAFSAPAIAGGVTATGTPVLNSDGSFVSVTITNAGSGYTSTATITATTATGVSVTGAGTSTQTVVYVNTSSIYAGMRVTGTGINAGATYVLSIGDGLVNLTAANASTVSGTLNFTDQPTTAVSFVTTLTTGRDNGLSVSAYVPGGSSGTAGDIVKQESSTRYLVRTSQASGVAGICRLTAAATGSLTSGQMNLIATDVNGSTYFVTKLTARRAVLTQYNNASSFEYADGAVANWSISAASAGVVSIATL